MTSKIKAALLIDADNLPVAQVREALKKLEGICNPIIRKAFGDFSSSAKNWTRDVLLETGITPMQHFPVSKYKNGADIAMCIAAMDIVHTRNLEAIILFTSDSDFGPLAARIREAGITVIGIGDQQTSETFRACFDTFIVVATPITPPITQPAVPKANAKSDISGNVNILPLTAAKNIIEWEMKQCEPENGWVTMSELGNRLKARKPKFVYKTYGFATLSKLLNKSGRFVVDTDHVPPRMRKK